MLLTKQDKLCDSLHLLHYCLSCSMSYVYFPNKINSRIVTMVYSCLFILRYGIDIPSNHFYSRNEHGSKRLKTGAWSISMFSNTYILQENNNNLYSEIQT